MNTRTSALVFLLTTIAIILQAFIWHAWNTGALNLFTDIYRNFGNQVPQALSFGARTASVWWIAPLGNALALSVVCFLSNRSRWLFLPLVLSFCGVIAMLFVMYSGPLVKMGEGVAIAA